MEWKVSEWHRHPGVRTGSELTFGERAADRMKNALATWRALIGFLTFMAAWIAVNTLALTHAIRFDGPPFILLNLLLSTIAGLQCFVLLISARRTDQIASQLALHDYEADQESRDNIRKLMDQFGQMADQHADMKSKVDAIHGIMTEPEQDIEGH